jgi:hypothetical protein
MEGTFSMNGLIRRGLLAALTAVAMTGAIAAPANAGILTVSATDCGDESLSQPFAGFGPGAVQAGQGRLLRGLA